MTLWALDGVVPVVRPTAWMHPDGDRVLIGSSSVVLDRVVVGDGSLIGAGALVAEGTVVPPDSRAPGVPARVRDGAGTAESVREAVALYVENARRHRDGLTRVG